MSNTAAQHRDTLYLIDGHAQFFRAYHAIRTPMSSPVTGEATNAVFGFIRLLLKILREYEPSRLAVVIDAAGDRGTFRSAIYPEYKANRTAAPEDFKPQVERCLALLKAANIPVIAAPRIEADDTLAAIVHRTRKDDPGDLVRIVSKDKDLQQLLEAGDVEMLDAHKDAVRTEETLLAETGLRPWQVADMLALAGDTADNIPGVEGVGPKTAAKLIAAHGSLDTLIEHADTIKGKRGEKLRAAIEAGVLDRSRALVALRTDEDGGFDRAAAETSSFDLGAMRPLLQELGLSRASRDLDALLGPPGKAAATGTTNTNEDAHTLWASEAPTADPDNPYAHVRLPDEPYRCIRTKAELDALVAELRTVGMVAVDTETTGVNPMRCDLCGVSVSTAEGHGAYIPVRSPEPDTHLNTETVLSALGPVLADPSVPKCGHHLKFDAIVLLGHGVTLRGIAFDSLLASHLLDPSRPSHKLDALAQDLLNRRTLPLSALLGKKHKDRTFDGVPLKYAAPYAAEDADIALRLRNAMAPELGKAGLDDLLARVEAPLVETLAAMEHAGIALDTQELDRQRETLSAKVETLTEAIDAEAAHRVPGHLGVNPDSPKQLAALLFNAADADPPGLGLKPVKKTKTGYSTDAEALEKLSTDPAIETTLPALILERRELAKLVGTYLVGLRGAVHPETGRVHTTFHQAAVSTGRLSSSDPNLQNIPIRTDTGRAIRRAFVAPAGRVLLWADYSQVELRMLAHLSKDAALIEAFQNGEDIHTQVAAQIHGLAPTDVTNEQRSAAKMVNFGIVYGITPYGLGRRLGITVGQAAEIIDGYKSRFPGIDAFFLSCVEQAKLEGSVRTLLGRRRPIVFAPGATAAAERLAINSVVQGSAAELIKLAMLAVHNALQSQTDKTGQGARLLLQIHDELLLEVPESTAAEITEMVRSKMESALTLRTPLRIDVGMGPTWWGEKQRSIPPPTGTPGVS